MVLVSFYFLFYNILSQSKSTDVAYGHTRVTVNATGFGFDSDVPFHRSSNEAEGGVEFRHSRRNA